MEVPNIVTLCGFEAWSLLLLLLAGWKGLLSLVLCKKKKKSLSVFQVTEETMQVVQSLGYTVTLRGVVNVKGKGELTTYFINTDQ